MSPPIRDGSGNDIGSIRLGDGSEIAEVRTGAGDVLFSAIPGSVVSRPSDNSTANNSLQLGIEISITQDWPSIGCRISSQTSGFSTGYLYTSSENLIKSVSISNLSSNDAFTFDNVNLTGGNNYKIVLDNNGSSYTIGFDDNPSFPFTSPDGNLEIIDGAQIGGSSSDALNIVEVGDVGF